jgi:hypothetical protein
MKRTLALVLATPFGLLGAAATAPAASAHEEHAVPADPASQVYVPLGGVRRAGGEFRVPLDPRRLVQSVALRWSDHARASQAAVLLDDLLVARRHVASLEREEIAVGRRGQVLRVVVERGLVHLDGVLVRYAGRARDRAILPTSVERAGPFALVAHFHRDLRSGDRLVLPAAFFGRRIREVRVQAAPLELRARVRLEGAGMVPQAQLFGRGDPVVFRLPPTVRDDQDLFLVADFRAVRVEDVRIVLEPGRRVFDDHGWGSRGDDSGVDDRRRDGDDDRRGGDDRGRRGRRDD